MACQVDCMIWPAISSNTPAMARVLQHSLQRPPHTHTPVHLLRDATTLVTDRLLAGLHRQAFHQIPFGIAVFVPLQEAVCFTYFAGFQSKNPLRCARVVKHEWAYRQSAWQFDKAHSFNHNQMSHCQRPLVDVTCDPQKQQYIIGCARTTLRC